MRSLTECKSPDTITVTLPVTHNINTLQNDDQSSRSRSHVLNTCWHIDGQVKSVGDSLISIDTPFSPWQPVSNTEWEMGNKTLSGRWIGNQPNRQDSTDNINGKVQIIYAHSKSYVFVLYLFSSTIVPRKQSAGVCTYKYEAMMADGWVGEGSDEHPVLIEEKRGKFAFTVEVLLPATCP